MRLDFKRQTLLYYAVLTLVLVVVLLLGASIDLFEIIVEFGRKHEIQELDEIIAATAVVSLLLFAFTLLQRYLAARELTGYRDQLRRLASELAQAESRERRRIATELHDHIGQNLVMARMKAQRLGETAGTPAIADSAHDLSKMLGGMIADIRSMIMEISPPILTMLGLSAALGWLAEQIQAEHGIPVEFSDDGLDTPLPEEMQDLLFRAVRELIINVIKHAGASRIELSIARTGRRITIEVEDDGVGFDASILGRHPNGRRGFGLFSIQERLSLKGGVLDIVSEAGRGTRATLIAPISPS